MIADPRKLMPIPIEARTEFDPAVHGFHFRNRYSGLDILGEINDGIGDVASRYGGEDFWEGWGLCGGMSWHALDRFYTKNPVPVTTATPARGSSLFRILTMRQLDSLRRGSLIAKCLRWQTGRQRRQWWDPRPTLGRSTVREWPKIRDSIDRGFPKSLTLVRAKTNPAENHQVLAVRPKRTDHGRG